MTVVSGADLVLPDRVLRGGTVVVDSGRIVSIREARVPDPDVIGDGHTLVPGFIDAHVHGVEGVDSLDPGDAVARIAAAMPRYGVTAFCPTTVACGPDDLRRVLLQVRACREHPDPLAARVLPAHLESNFINPAYRGAQPAACLRTWAPQRSTAADALAGPAFTSDDIARVLEAHIAELATVTLAPEVDGGMELLRWLASCGVRVSLGHSGATDVDARAAAAAGACQVTHLFNAMPPAHHRRPGLAGFALQTRDLAVELICDGAHVHPVMVRLVLAAKGSARVLAVSDATAAAGLPSGSPARLGGQTIYAADTCAVRDDGTMAGSTTMLDAAFGRLTREMDVSLVDAVRICATTPARELGLDGCGVIAEDAAADLVLLDAHGDVAQTWVAGRRVYSRLDDARNSRVRPSV